jgi:signal transduction histidine kinase
MKRWPWLQDTIARRFAVTVALAAAVTLTLVYLFLTFGGEWARPGIRESGLPEETAFIVQLIETAPPQTRQALAAAARTGTVTVDWYNKGSPVPAAVEGATDAVGKGEVMDDFIRDIHRTVVGFRPDSRIWAIPELSKIRSEYPDAHLLAVKLTDGSWLAFTVLHRSWGLAQPLRWALWLVFLAVSIAIVSTIAARQLSRPVKKLAEAVHLFGLNPQAPAIAETGPIELRQVIRTFNAMQAQIQKFLAYRTAMLAAISHDLRTPLTRIRLRGELIEDQEQQAKLFRDVGEMQAMVDGALAFFRDDAVDEGTTAFDLPGVLRTIANDFADQGVNVVYIGPARAVYRGRPFALKRAFTNLVENAVKYGTAPEVELSCEGQVFVVAVRDRGPGIPPDALEQVFSPFYRLDKSRNRATGGVGLGLTAAQAIVRAHGGEITLHNRSEGGLEARVTLHVIVQAGALPVSEALKN